MCERKPLGRCASSIAKQKVSLTLKETKIVGKLNELYATGSNMNVLQLVEKELIEVRLKKAKNDIDFYSSSTGQEHFRLAQNQRRVLTEEENLNRLNGLSRRVWQNTFAKKLFQLEEAHGNQTESLHNAEYSAQLMLHSLTYELEAKKALLSQKQQLLRNPELHPESKRDIETKIRKIQLDTIVTEMNIADTNAYLTDNHKRFESLILGKIYRAEQHA